MHDTEQEHLRFAGAQAAQCVSDRDGNGNRVDGSCDLIGVIGLVSTQSSKQQLTSINGPAKTSLVLILLLVPGVGALF